jgi:tetratricopeptide (TPR) repeat protein
MAAKALLVLALLAPQSTLDRARELGLAGDYAGAIRLLRPLSDPPARKLLAKTLLLTGDRIESEQILRELTTRSPGDYEVWSLLGRLYQETNRHRQAFEPLERALKLNPRDVFALTALANSYIGVERIPEALRTFERAIAVHARQSTPHASYAFLLLRLDRVEQASEQIRLALALNPKDPLALEAQRGLQLRLQAPALPNRDRKGADPPRFRDLPLPFRLENSPTPAKHQIETMPGGVAVLDYDNDGLLDIYFTNGAESPSLRKSHPRFWNRLYRNAGNHSFTDVTEKAGVPGAGYMMGAAAGDYNNDGHTDLFVVGVDRNILYRNNGDGTFTDATAQAGLASRGWWGIHAAWLDYDADGWLDLLVVNYCLWDPRTEPYCGDLRPGHRTYCHPNRYKPLPNQLYHNNGNGTFTDVSEASGIAKHLGKGMGAAIADYDQDGRIDIFVANDTEPNFLFHNEGGGRFRELALEAGVAYNQFGKALSSMGADFRDLDNDGLPDLFVTTLSNEGFLLFRNAGSGRFDDFADRSGLSLPTLPFSGWSNAIADFNNDGLKDLFSANGHAIDNIHLTQSRTYHQVNTLYQQIAPGLLRDVPAFERPAAHRGAAVADFDNDGKLDLVVTALGNRAALLHNVTPSAGHWLTLRLDGPSIGARVRVETSDGRALYNHATTSVGFASSSDPRVHFGLGESKQVRSVEIIWPSGRRQKLDNVEADRILTVPYEDLPASVRSPAGPGR